MTNPKTENVIISTISDIIKGYNSTKILDKLRLNKDKIIVDI
jgi:hypothetical protein